MTAPGIPTRGRKAGQAIEEQGGPVTFRPCRFRVGQAVWFCDCLSVGEQRNGITGNLELEMTKTDVAEGQEGC